MLKILLTNDDGFQSAGLMALRNALRENFKNAEILVVAPASEKSACGHGLSLTKPLSFIEVEKNFYKLDDGTPSDCIYLALHALYEKESKPDIIISGINLGSNMGEDVTYSGTVAAAMEGAIQGIFSVAISQVVSDKLHANKHLLTIDSFALAQKTIIEIVENFEKNGAPFLGRKLLNVNIPPCEIKECQGKKITNLGYRLYGNAAHKAKNPRGMEYFWLGLHPLKWQKRAPDSTKESAKDLLCDFDAISQKYISLTPLHVDLTSYNDLANLRAWAK